jgi:alpha-D-ribose 1-methylphosphonate 5-triphosphate synthase subunit PhnH
MSAALDLAGISAGFSEPGAGSQAVFRSALEALSRPGRVVEIPSDAAAPVMLHPASAALGLALLDQDTRAWLGSRVRRAGPYFRFHTGCALVERPQQADFAFLAGHELRELEDFSCGSDEYPERSATLVLQVQSLHNGDGWTLAGPGIRGTARLAVGGLPERFVEQWKRNAARFPRGVDVFLTCGEVACGLPRTTRIEA